MKGGGNRRPATWTLRPRDPVIRRQNAAGADSHGSRRLDAVRGREVGDRSRPPSVEPNRFTDHRSGKTKDDEPLDAGRSRERPLRSETSPS